MTVIKKNRTTRCFNLLTLLSILFSPVVMANDMTTPLDYQWMFFGFLLAMATSNLLFFLTTQRPKFIIYSGYVISVAMLVASVSGILASISQGEWVQHHANMIFGNLVLIFILLFSKVILDVKVQAPGLAKGVNIIISAMLLNLVICLFVPDLIPKAVLLAFAAMIILALIATGVHFWREGDILAPYYIFAWLVLLISLSSILLKHYGKLVGFNISEILMFGSLIETITLSLVLALRYKYQTEETEVAQQLAIEHEIQAREAQDELLRIQQDAQEELEYKVDERTFELRIALQELEEANRQLEEKNTQDGLTGIRNRAFFDKKIQQELRRSRRAQSQLCIVMLDIDHFKSINDQYGHPVGDDCIRFVALSLKQHLKRPSDEACRYGGEEFTLILPDTTLEGAQRVAENIRQFIQEHSVPTPTVDVNMTISCGVAISDTSVEQTPTELIEKADKALYQAKQQGRNQVILADS